MKARLRKPDKEQRILQISSRLDILMEEFTRTQNKIWNMPPNAKVQKHAPLWRKLSNIAAECADLVEKAAEIERNEGEQL